MRHIADSKPNSFRISLCWVLPILLLGIAFFPQLQSCRQQFELSSELDHLYEKPWSLVTYCLFHQTTLQLFFANILLGLVISLSGLSVGKFLSLFLTGSVVGGLFFIILLPLIHSGQGVLIGSSGGISALVPVTLYNVFGCKSTPKAKRYGSLLIVVLFIDVLTFLYIQSPGFFAHIGGYVIGIVPLLIKVLNKLSIDKKNEALKMLYDKVNESGLNSLETQEWELLLNDGHSC